MDKNKLQVLHEIDYKIPLTCGNCQYGTFKIPSSNFGTCAIYNYRHLKHSGMSRPLSVSRYGTCDTGVWDERALGELGLWTELTSGPGSPN